MLTTVSTLGQHCSLDRVCLNWLCKYYGKRTRIWVRRSVVHNILSINPFLREIPRFYRQQQQQRYREEQRGSRATAERDQFSHFQQRGIRYVDAPWIDFKVLNLPVRNAIWKWFPYMFNVNFLKFLLARTNFYKSRACGPVLKSQTDSLVT